MFFVSLIDPCGQENEKITDYLSGPIAIVVPRAILLKQCSPIED